MYRRGLGVFKKTEKPIKPRKQKKNRLNRLKFWKNRPVRFGFGFLSLEPKKSNETKPNPNRKKPSQNQAKLVWTGFCSKKPNRTETGQFEPVSVFKKKFSLVTFFDKNRTEPKMNTPNVSFSTTLIKI